VTGTLFHDTVHSGETEATALPALLVVKKRLERAAAASGHPYGTGVCHLDDPIGSRCTSDDFDPFIGHEQAARFEKILPPAGIASRALMAR